VHCIGDTGLVGTHAADADGVGSVGCTAVCEARSNESNDVVPPGKDEEPKKTFIAINDKVSAKFLGFLIPLY
jgi:hypothetical protein